ncbi:TetR/AcrR family transcriptional regulator [Bosea sp. (in: a-proteobacteria)]|uniref:TetR/AcrR family transcriptional regulator n=1 Tax=Bosea sp. (in: a-proteobacteria) TaxID=1871050 RepID=UPI001AD149BF|nr:TetR/AcrR family transcriptional regulator [Bosea sp. (in: a-proteobacteria)]MBN9445142.1 TetR/AcrR family transcriptional regulator [Bosea sp. (in: a-proteobacteria)]
MADHDSMKFQTERSKWFMCRNGHSARSRMQKQGTDRLRLRQGAGAPRGRPRPACRNLRAQFLLDLATIDCHENEHSFSFRVPMSTDQTAFLPDTALSERHIRILDAAERVFARAGFHAATMQDVAMEAGMSPGNLYRYFSSKDAIIAGMAERDRSTIAADFAALCPSRGPLLDQLEEIGRKHLVRQPREKAVIALQIWAEASRNEEMARMCAGIEETLIGGLIAALGEAKRTGELPPDLDEQSFLMAISMMADGFFCRRAIEPQFDAEAGADVLFRSMHALARVLPLSATPVQSLETQS